MQTKINGHNTFYLDEGNSDKTPIIFIHGFPLDHRMWQPQIEAFKESHRVIAYDVRGLGQSDIGDGQYTMEMYSDDLIALMDDLKIEKAIWCGLSMGGYIALRAIEKHPNRCQALILCDTRSEADTDIGKIRRAQFIDEIKKYGVPKFSEDFLSTIFTPQNLKDRPSYITEVSANIENQSQIGICGAMLAIGMRSDTTANLINIDVPTLILVGEHDQLTPVSVSQNMHHLIKNSQLKIIPNAAHMSNLENPTKFNEHIKSFLK